jgi:hypothetical protein
LKLLTWCKDQGYFLGFKNKQCYGQDTVLPFNNLTFISSFFITSSHCACVPMQQSQAVLIGIIGMAEELRILKPDLAVVINDCCVARTIAKDTSDEDEAGKNCGGGDYLTNHHVCEPCPACGMIWRRSMKDWKLCGQERVEYFESHVFFG